MAVRKIYITAFDKARLEKLIEGFGNRKREDIEALAEELEEAEIVSAEDVQPEVVTMNSRVVLRDIDTSEELTYTLVFPKDANMDQGAISVLAPVGTAILGYSKGDIIEWPVPSGMRRLKIENILYQPESAGDYHL